MDSLIPTSLVGVKRTTMYTVDSHLEAYQSQYDHYEESAKG